MNYSDRYNMNILSKLNNKIVFAFVFAIFTIIYFLLNDVYPLFADDWMYVLIYGDETKWVKSIGDVAVSQYNHYFMWGGRTVVHFICQLLLMLDDFWLSVVNTLAYSGFLYLIYRFVNIGNSMKVYLFMLINILFWFLLPDFCATVLWITGSANYLWGTLIILLFISPFIKSYYSDTSGESKLKGFALFFFGIIAGWTNENMCMALIFFIVALFVLLYIEKRKIPLWMKLGLLGVIIGAAFMLLAPGNYVRIERDFSWQNNLSFLGLMYNRMKNMMAIFMPYLFPMVIVYILAIFVHQKYTAKSNESLKKIRLSLLFLTSSAVGFAAMIASPTFPLRATFGVVTFLIIAVCILLANIHLSKNYIKIIGYMILAIGVLFFAYDAYKKYSTIRHVRGIFDEREAYVLEQKSKGIVNVTFTETYSVEDKYWLFDFSEDENNWLNQQYRKYLGIESVKTIVTSDSDKK